MSAASRQRRWHRRTIREVCAWCTHTIRKGRGAHLLSHGICKRCGRKVLRQYEESRQK